MPLRLPLGTLQLGLVEFGSGGDGRFPILKRLSASQVVPRERGRRGLAVDEQRRLRVDRRWATSRRAERRAAVHPAARRPRPSRCFEPELAREIAARSPLGAAADLRPAVPGPRSGRGRDRLPPVRPGCARSPTARCRRRCGARCRPTARPTRRSRAARRRPRGVLRRPARPGASRYRGGGEHRARRAPRSAALHALPRHRQGDLRPGRHAEPVTCPWCEGTGRYQPGHDAQAARGERVLALADHQRPDLALFLEQLDRVLARLAGEQREPRRRVVGSTASIRPSTLTLSGSSPPSTVSSTRSP